MVYSHQPMTTNSFQGPFLAVPVWAVDVINKCGQPRDLQVLVGLVALMDRRNKEVTASVQQLSLHLGISKETTKRSLRWLTEYGVITTRRRKNPNVNVYTVHYTDAGMGSRMTLDGVTHDPMVGSPVTLAGGVDGVTHDPSYPHFYDDLAGETQSSIEVLIKRVVLERTERAASGTEDEMIIGADPDEPQEFERSSKKKPALGKTNKLVNHFVSNRQAIMTASYDQKSLIILRRTFNILLNSGITEFTIMQMVNKFFAIEKWRTSNNPALLFCSKDIQRKLMEQVDTTVEVEDPVMSLMLNDFVREALELPWPEPQDKLLKRAIVMHATEVCYRYPELVSKVAHQYSGDFANADFVNYLSALNSLVRYVNGDDQEDPTDVLNTLRSFELPVELQKMSKASLRPSASSISEAVYNYRRFSHG